MKIIYSAVLLAFLFISCDEITPPYTEDSDPVVTDTTKKNVLIEYYTGAKCGNCPPAGKEAVRLEKLYDGKVIFLANHVGVFANTDPAGGKYDYDFKCPVGQEIDGKYKISEVGTPQGIINRTDFNGSVNLSYGTWEAAVNAELEKSAPVKINLEPSYNNSTNTISLSSEIEYFQKSEEKHYFVVYIVEDSIIRYQKWYGHDPLDIPDYVHRNTLRSSMNGAWGDQLEAFSSAKGGVIEVVLDYSIPETADWVPKNLKLIAVVYNDDDSRSVANVEMVELRDLVE